MLKFYVGTIISVVLYAFLTIDPIVNHDKFVSFLMEKSMGISFAFGVLKLLSMASPEELSKEYKEEEKFIMIDPYITKKYMGEDHLS